MPATGRNSTTFSRTASAMAGTPHQRRAMTPSSTNRMYSCRLPVCTRPSRPAVTCASAASPFSEPSRITRSPRRRKTRSGDPVQRPAEKRSYSSSTKYLPESSRCNAAKRLRRRPRARPLPPNSHAAPRSPASASATETTTTASRDAPVPAALRARAAAAAGSAAPPRSLRPPTAPPARRGCRSSTAATRARDAPSRHPCATRRRT